MALRISIREGFKTIIRNRSLFVLSLLVVAIALFLLSLFGLVTVNLYQALKVLDEKIEIVAFLEESADVASLKSKILKINGVKEVIYVSREQALQDLQGELKETDEILRIFQTNPLPASLRIKLDAPYRNGSALAAISEKIMLLRGIKETIYGGELVDELKRITKIITIFDLGLLLIIVFSVVFVIFQTIKLTIFAKATEIEIMKLVGASDLFIAIPFTFEGLIQGIMGGVMAFVLTMITYHISVSIFKSLYFYPWWFLLGNVACGMFLGIIGSAIALQKFLK